MMQMRHVLCNMPIGLWLHDEPPVKGSPIHPDDFQAMGEKQPIGYCAHCQAHVPPTDENVVFHRVMGR